MLEPARPGSPCCFSCRNGQNWAFKGWTAGKLEAKINEDASFAFRYKIVIFTWEEKANNPGAPLVKYAAELPSCFRAAVFS